MVYDDQLADRIRALVAGETGLTEKMSGGLASLAGGNMASAATAPPRESGLTFISTALRNSSPSPVDRD
jgi:hypothetical protein